jgi:hypothetical protein
MQSNADLIWNGSPAEGTIVAFDRLGTSACSAGNSELMLRQMHWA